MMKKLLSIVFTVTMISTSGLALAARHLGNVGGDSADHISTEGIDNSNGPNALDPERGMDRADLRRNDASLDNGDNGSKGLDQDAPSSQHPTVRNHMHPHTRHSKH